MRKLSRGAGRPRRLQFLFFSLLFYFFFLSAFFLYFFFSFFFIFFFGRENFKILEATILEKANCSWGPLPYTLRSRIPQRLDLDGLIEAFWRRFGDAAGASAAFGVAWGSYDQASKAILDPFR